MVRQARKCTQKTCRKAVEALPAIVESVVGAILSFLGKAVGLVAEHAWVLIVFVAGLFGVWLMQKAKKKVRPNYPTSMKWT